MAEWALKPFDTIQRKALHDQFGGRRQGGIGPSRQSPNVFLFTNPEAGRRHGYQDVWDRDDVFHYTGEGQVGDQSLTQGNKAILTHVEDGRAIRIFDGASGTVTYMGEFVLDTSEPWYTTDAPETGGGPVRTVIVFRLRPLDDPPDDRETFPPTILASPGTTPVPVEKQHTEKAFVEPTREPYEAERREQKLVLDLKRHLESLERSVCRLRIVPPGEAKPLFTDLYDEAIGTLIEAKGTVERGAIRMAIGQLADYRRFVDGANHCAVLLPSQPRQDLLALLKAEDIHAIWPEKQGFVDTVNGTLVGMA
ncbi:MAG TPA: hypothetical protein VN238_11980 [Solirubrobacteraceae bacterium]|nr:hypothetical protein [Solirubrobacteraceae bacterium]